jgi:hypothetical protein
MPAFMAGLGMRQGQPRRQFNEQAAGANQYTSALNNASGTGPSGAATGGDTGPTGAPKTPTTGAENYNPYAAAASGGANPWTYNASTGGYEPNSSAWTPDWMKPKPAAPAPAAKTYERQIADYTPYADDMRGTKQQAIDIMAAEAKKRGITPNWNELEGKYGSRLENGQVTGKLFNEIMKDAFGKDVEVPGAAAPAAPAATPPAANNAAPPAAPSNPWMTAGGGYGGYMPTQMQGQAGGLAGMAGNTNGDMGMMRDRLGMPIGRMEAQEATNYTPEQKAQIAAKEAAMRGNLTEGKTSTADAQARMAELIKQLGAGGMQFMQGMGG